MLYEIELDMVLQEIMTKNVRTVTLMHKSYIMDEYPI